MTATRTIEAVLFDLDGTIIDTNELIIESFLHALKGIVPESFGRTHIIPSMGEPLTKQLQQFSGRQDVENLTRLYREYNHLRHDEMVSLFPRVDIVMRTLHEAGIKIGIVTTKMRASSIRALELLGVYKYVDTLVGLDDVEHAKPHPEPVAKAIAALEVDASAAFMVGDSSVDMKSAIAAGVVPVGVDWSLKGADLLYDSGAVHMLHDMNELLTLCGIEGGGD